LCALIAVSIAAGIAAPILARRWIVGRAERVLREKALETLRTRFSSEVEVRDVQITVYPHLTLNASGVAFRYHGRQDIPPLIQFDRLHAEGDMEGLLLTRPHIRLVKIEGLTIHVPPHSEEGKGTPKPAHAGRTPYGAVVVDRIIADGARLEIQPKGEGKEPLLFDIHNLDMRAFSLDNASQFNANLTNPKPKGEIATTGRFGPWQGEIPGKTPVQGDYVFSHADLGTFKGIGGILSSKGAFHGALEQIQVDGETDTPNFSLSYVGRGVYLHTKFHSVVDGTNGNTWLKPVHAKLLGSAIEATGGVVRVEGAKGRNISIDFQVPAGRIEDFLRLSVKTDQPPLSGALHLKGHLEIPPGEKSDAIERMRLRGEFHLERAQFSSATLRDKLRGLSRRAQGLPRDPSAGSAVSNMGGQFQLRDGVVNFSDLTFDLDGAAIRLVGNYALKSEAMDFRGTLHLDAKLSQMTTGFKSLLLKAVDPFFSDGNGGELIHFKIGGTRSNPAVGLDFSKHNSK
jgi:hypothetical protein